MTQSASHVGESAQSPSVVRPIIVVGMIRSGTKWVSNLIGKSPDVVVPQDDHHGGVIETNMFFHLERDLGRLSNPDAFAATVALWPQTDLYRATGLPNDLPQSISPKPHNHFDLYDRCMCHWAEQVGSRYWLQKTAPGFLPGIASQLSERQARMIFVRRDPTETLHSLRQHNKNNGRNDSASRLSVSICLQNRMIDRLVHHFSDSMVVQYRDLANDASSVLRDVCGYLEIDFDHGMLESGFRANTSFKGGAKQSVGLGTRLAMSSMRSMTYLCPYGLLRKLQRRFGGQGSPLLTGTFSRYHAELTSKSTSRDLSEMNNE